MRLQCRRREEMKPVALAWQRLDPVGARSRETPFPGGRLRRARAVAMLLPQRVAFESGAESARPDRHRQALPIALLDLRRAQHGLVEGDVDEMQRAADFVRRVLTPTDVVALNRIRQALSALAREALLVGRAEIRAGQPVAIQRLM